MAKHASVQFIDSVTATQINRLNQSTELHQILIFTSDISLAVSQCPPVVL